MVKVNLGGCSSFVKDAEYNEYVGKALSALEVLENETGKGNDFLGWKHLVIMAFVVPMQSLGILFLH